MLTSTTTQFHVFSDRYQRFGSTTDRSKGLADRGSQLLLRVIRVFHPRHPTVTATDTVSDVRGLRRVSVQTIRNPLRDFGLGVRMPYYAVLFYDVSIDIYVRNGV